MSNFDIGDKIRLVKSLVVLEVGESQVVAADGDHLAVLHKSLVEAEPKENPKVEDKEDREELRASSEELPLIVLRTGDDNEYVTVVQRSLIDMGFDLGFGGPSGKGDDGQYGKKTEFAVEHFQQYRMVRSADGKRAADEGTYGPSTAKYMKVALEESYRAGEPWRYKGVLVYGWRHPRYGRIPNTEGKTSTFGGPDDKGDRRLGQARVYVKTAAELYSRYNDLVKEGLFRLDGNDVPYRDPLPEVDGVGWTGWGTGPAGISWLLNPDSFYCALRTKSPQPDVRHSRVVFFMKGKACITAVTDWGPHVSTGRNSDLSPGTLHGALDGRTDDWIENQCWAADHYPLGLLGRNVNEEWEPGDTD